MNWQLYILAFIFITVGLFHFIRPKAFMKVMPLYIPFHKAIVYLSGAAEILAGCAIFYTPTRFVGLRGIIIMLILFFPVHIHMLIHKKAGLNLPKFILIFRLVLQFGLIYWVWTLTI